MKPERKKALILIGTTLVIGIFIGALTIGLIGRHNRGKQPSVWRKDGKEAFIQKILTLVEADSDQAKLIRPLIIETISQIDSLQIQTDSVVNSFEVKLQPILNEKQMENLQQFHKRGRKTKEGR